MSIENKKYKPDSLKFVINRSIILVHHFRNNYTIHLPANPSVQVEKPRRSPLRLRFFTCTLESASYAIGIVIYETMY